MQSFLQSSQAFLVGVIQHYIRRYIGILCLFGSPEFRRISCTEEESTKDMLTRYHSTSH